MTLDKLNVMDWLAHGGHQYEFFKTGPNFYCTKKDGYAPKHTELGRPKNNNINFIEELNASKNKYDIIIIRSGLNPERYRPFLKNNLSAVGVAVVQTTTPFAIPRFARYVIWNSITVMNANYKSFPNKKHYYIPHGFDPQEFAQLKIKRNNRILSSFSAFKKRSAWLGYDEWRWVSDRFKKNDLLGHDNDQIPECIGSFGLEELVVKYNQYSAYLNTSTKSAMPRSRGEALMCGTPIITTNNYDIGGYLKNGKSCIFANSKEEMLDACIKISSSKQLQDDLSNYGREAALKYFHISKYIQKWQDVFEDIIRGK